MNPVQFSILHATRGRPEKAVAAMKMWEARAAAPSAIEYIFAVDEEDEHTQRNLIFGPTKFYHVFVCFNEGRGSAPAWNTAAKRSVGHILIQASDDFQCPDAWDVKLMRRLYTNAPTVIAVSDGYRNDSLLTMAICNRARYDQQGEFLHPGYASVFSDDDFSYKAYRDERDGKCAVINARDLVFKHEHHYHNKTVPFDATYERQNSPENYEQGRKLFFERNPEAATDGLRNWA
jgi:hypothetical protein